MNVIDTSGHIPEAFEEGRFRLPKWEKYMDAHVPGAKDVCLADLAESIRKGCSWENDVLPVLDAAAADPERLEKAARSFRKVTEGLDERILKAFGRTVDADVVLYLGLCNGAGWATEVRGRRTLLLGVEKILELDWCGEDAMNGLVLHETGHVYHEQYGAAEPAGLPTPDRFLWQLFSEGVAMVFEQEALGDPGYFHQDRDEWKDRCEANEGRILRSFAEDLPAMTPATQRYFGDRVRFMGMPDTGYYLGAKFVRHLMRDGGFDAVIRYGTREIREGFARYAREAGAEGTKA